MSSFENRLRGYRLTTAEILYHMPDHPELLQSFTTLVLPPGYLEGILKADGPDGVFEAGVAAAVSLGRGFFDIDGVVGVNLSGGAGPGQALKFARALARIGRELRNNPTYGAES